MQRSALPAPSQILALVDWPKKFLEPNTWWRARGCRVAPGLMVLPAAGPVGGVGRSHPLLNAFGATRSSHAWLEDLDDVPLTGNDPGEADVERAVVVDEEALLDEPSTSGRQEVQETLKLLLSGGVAGAVSKSATAPLARLTILYQVRTPRCAGVPGGAASACRCTCGFVCRSLGAAFEKSCRCKACRLQPPRLASP